MKKDFTEEIKKLAEYKARHKFSYKEIANTLETTTRSLRRWLKGDYIPLPIYRSKIRKLLK